LATIVEVEYQLPADFECPNAVFSWIWHTPHLCIPKVVVDAGAENDVWKFCNRNLQGYYAACATEWQDEIFTNCMDAEVVGDGAAPSPPAATARPVVPADPVPAPGSPQGGCAPVGDCGVLGWCDQEKYASWCAGHSSGCPAPFCQKAADAKPAPVPNPVPNPAPTPSSTGRCVASLEPYYTDASIYEPLCKTMGEHGTCPSPMCKTTSSLVATGKRHKRHSFLGNALLQTRSDVDSGHPAEEL